MQLAVAVVVAVASLSLGAAPDPRLRAGVFLHDAGKLGAAIALYRELLAEHPHEPAAVFELALTLVADRQYDEGITFIEAELKNGAQSPRLYAVLARAHAAKSQPELSLAALERGLKVAPDNAELLYGLGAHHGAREDWPRAIDALTACARADPESPSGWAGLARAYEATNEPARAVAAQTHAVLARSPPPRVKASAQRVRELASTPSQLARMLKESGDPFFGDAPEHLVALAHDVFRAGGDAAAELWCAEHPREVDAWRAWVKQRVPAR
ncbi:MAG: tetratricopeptide repeat protein [Myxococcaceae bacterium]|nr:tetratricopeptide repeat protein [Myxococcaceae bacterium]